MASPEQVAQRLGRFAERAGADAFDVLAIASETTGVGVRGGELEDIESTGGLDVGLRVFRGRRSAVVSGSDVSDDALSALAGRAVAMADNAPEDPYAGLADPDRLASGEGAARLDLRDDTELSPEALKQRALETEAAALSVIGVAQAEGASSSQTRSRFQLLTSHGFSGGWESTRHTLGVSAFAESDGHMERDYDHHGQRHIGDLPSPDTVGRTAGERAVARLGSRSLASTSVPVVFDKRVAGSVLGAFLSAISGPSIARGTSFLKERMGESVFNESITIHDDPTRVRGLGSRPFDAEGLRPDPLKLVEAGVLSHWLLNTASARQLGLQSNARARRGVGGIPGVAPTNSWIAAGPRAPDALIASDGRTLVVKEMFGPSLNPNTGDYSVGVAGVLHEDGEAHPVSEITIAGNLLEMFSSLEAANDLVFDGAVVSPTLRVSAMTVAGQ